MTKNLNTIKKHFQKVDPVIAPVIELIDFTLLQSNADPTTYFAKLCSEIISQQLSGKVADVIFERFMHLFPHQKITAKKLLTISDDQLRAVGMSWAKVKYLKDLALKTVQEEVNFAALPNGDDEAVIAELTKIKGIGRWTAEMFLMFTLGREDIFSFGDLGLWRGAQKLYQLQDMKPAEAQKKMAKITSVWAPYRSYGSLALWRSLEL